MSGRSCLIVSLCLLAWCVSPAQGESIQGEPLVVSQDHAWPPFAFRDAQGQPRGLLVEFWIEIGQRMGRPVEFHLADWPDSIRQVREGQAQVHGGLVPSPERRVFLDFSTELLPLETYLFVASSSAAIRVDDLAGIPIGVTEASFEAEFMAREHPGMHLRPFRNNEQMILSAVRGEINAFVADYPVGLYLLDRHARPTDFRVLQGLYRQPLVAAVPKGDTELLRAIDAALATFDADDRRRLVQRWVRSEKVEVLPGWLIPAGFAVLLILSLALYSLMLWRQRRQLAREIAARTADLRANETKYRAIVENANDIIYSLSPTGILTYVSPNWAEKLGHDVHEVVGKPFDPFVHPDDLARCYEFLSKAIETRVKQSGVEYRVRHVDGDWHWHVSNASPVLDDDGEVTQVIGIARDITERKDLEVRMMRMAHYDPLTDLPNRVLFYDRADQALRLARRAAGRMALLLLDLDEFKPVNDDHGHAVGDLLLQEAARRMMSCLRTSDTVGRIGGDEFVVLLPMITGVHDATDVAEKLRVELARPFQLAGRELHISCSIGIALYPEHGNSMVELTKSADLAMYVAKDAGRNRWSVFHQHLPDTADTPGPRTRPQMV